MDIRGGKCLPRDESLYCQAWVPKENNREGVGGLCSTLVGPATVSQQFLSPECSIFNLSKDVVPPEKLLPASGDNAELPLRGGDIGHGEATCEPYLLNSLQGVIQRRRSSELDSCSVAQIWYLNFKNHMGLSGLIGDGTHCQTMMGRKDNPWKMGVS